MVIAVTIKEAVKGAGRDRHHLHGFDPPCLHTRCGDAEGAFDLGAQFGHGDEPGWRRQLPPGRSQRAVVSIFHITWLDTFRMDLVNMSNGKNFFFPWATVKVFL